MKPLVIYSLLVMNRTYLPSITKKQDLTGFNLSREVSCAFISTIQNKSKLLFGTSEPFHVLSSSDYQQTEIEKTKRDRRMIKNQTTITLLESYTKE